MQYAARVRKAVFIIPIIACTIYSRADAQEDSNTNLALRPSQVETTLRNVASARARKLPIAHYSHQNAQRDIIRALTGKEDSEPLLEVGTSKIPFSTARADLSGYATNRSYPYSPTGKVFYQTDEGWTYCSASLIRRGLVVTAAHCVAQYGTKKYFDNFYFVPAYRERPARSGIYGFWKAGNPWVKTSYLDGRAGYCVSTDPGVVCSNDIAVLPLYPKLNRDKKAYYPGDIVGSYDYSVVDESSSNLNIRHVTQLGYPECLDHGERMQRNDSQSVTAPADMNNTMFGSLMCGGASGGPILINFGVRPELTGTQSGSDAKPNTVIGVTSFGSEHDAVKYTGASPFTRRNISSLVDDACCAKKSGGSCVQQHAFCQK
jgi:V8-like Glu-specific endopeptidase